MHLLYGNKMLDTSLNHPVEAKEIKESQKAVRGSKRVDASLGSSERYKKNLRETLENEKRKM